MADEKELREGAQFVYRTLFDTVAGYMAPTPGKLYTVSPRRRILGNLSSSTATAANAFNTVLAAVPLTDTLNVGDAIWLEVWALDINLTISGQATIQSAAAYLSNVNTFTELLPLGQIVETTLVASSTNPLIVPIVPLTPFVSFQDMLQAGSLRFALAVQEPIQLVVRIGFLNGAGVNQVMQVTPSAIYRKVSSIQEG